MWPLRVDYGTPPGIVSVLAQIEHPLNVMQPRVVRLLVHDLTVKTYPRYERGQSWEFFDA
jgi:hypothetical protein